MIGRSFMRSVFGRGLEFVTILTKTLDIVVSVRAAHRKWNDMVRRVRRSGYSFFRTMPAKRLRSQPSQSKRNASSTSNSILPKHRFPAADAPV